MPLSRHDGDCLTQADGLTPVGRPDVVQCNNRRMPVDDIIATGRLRTSGGALGMKRIDCDVSVTRRDIRINLGRRQDVVPLATITGTKRIEFREAPWGPRTTQLALEKATSNQFGANLVLLLTHKHHIDEGLAVFAAIEAAVGSPSATTADSPTGDHLADLLRKLRDLHAAGVLTDDEFAGKKQELLDRM